MPTAAPQPPGRSRSRCIPDPARDRLLYFLWDEHEAGGEIWSLELAGVLRWTPLGAPDYELSGTVEGIAGDTLVMHGLGAVRGRPGARTIAASLADLTHARTLFDAIWPPGSRGDVLVRDSARDRWLLVGGQPVTDDPHDMLGFLGGPLDSLWELTLRGTLVSWRLVTIDGETPTRSDVYFWAVDEGEGALYLLNGCNTATGGVAGTLELWVLRTSDSPRWERVATGGADDWPRLGCGVLVFDSVRRKLVSFGYRDPATGQPVNEVWEFDVERPSGWSRSSAAGQPIGCPSDVTAAFDGASSRVVAMGRYGEVEILVTSPELRWEGVACRDGTTDPCLPATWGRGAVYDPIGLRLIALGHYDPFWLSIGPGSPLFEVSAGESTGVARMLETVGTPGWQAAPTFGYDAGRDALLVYGIRSNGLPVLHEYLFGREGRLLAKVSKLSALEDRISLRWSATPDAELRLWRRTPAGEWLPRAELRVPASGALAFDDREIEAGQRYGYRLTSALAPYAPASADIWLTASVASSFSLAPPWPNPSRGSLNLAFTLAASAPAELDVFDLAGRRVWSRRWDALGAGPHHVALAAGELPRSGLYFVRLRQAGRTATARVIVTR